MTWEKLGLVYAPAKNKWWNQKYAQLPVPIYIEDENVVRVFFGTACDEVFCRITHVDLNPENLLDIVNIPDNYSLDLGPLGHFDDSGVVPSSLFIIDKKLYLYTVGYQRSGRVPYMLFAGLIESNDLGKSFHRTSLAPILPRLNSRPTSQGAPSVIYHNGVYKMWHWFSTKWIKVEGKPFLDYKIGYAESQDGINWEMLDHICLEADHSKDEFAVARPWVIFEDDTFKMWFSKRIKGKMYRIGYAESKDGLDWIRRQDPIGMDVSKEGWDSEMICYPSILDLKGERYMFYNGNSNGLSGFGIAKLVQNK